MKRCYTGMDTDAEFVRVKFTEEQLPYVVPDEDDECDEDKDDEWEDDDDEEEEEDWDDDGRFDAWA